MNTVWSSCLQSIDTLYKSRTLRFSDLFRDKYLPAFAIEDHARILEIGCGPGALAAALHRWYPDAEITGLDRDSAFIDYASNTEPDIPFLEGDAMSLPFVDGTFDVTISNTVAEHIPPEKFFTEQHRVLKPGGICLVLSARRGIRQIAPCIAEESDFEKEIWSRTEEICHETNRKYAVGAYRMTEAEYPAEMAKYGFGQISTEYITVNLTPDNPCYDRETAYAMINAERSCAVDGADQLFKIAPGVVTSDEIEELKRQLHAKFDRRIALYDAGIKQWDTELSLTMILRGVKEGKQ